MLHSATNNLEKLRRFWDILVLQSIKFARGIFQITINKSNLTKIMEQISTEVFWNPSFNKLNKGKLAIIPLFYNWISEVYSKYSITKKNIAKQFSFANKTTKDCIQVQDVDGNVQWHLIYDNDIRFGVRQFKIIFQFTKFIII